MGQRGQHVVIVDDSAARQRILEMIMERTGRWVTIAQNGDEALAILKSTLHPLVVLVNARISYPLDGRPASLLRTLLANQEFTATHAFIVTTPPRSDDERRELEEAIQQMSGAVHVGWLDFDMSGRIANAVVGVTAATDEAERYLKARA